MIVIPKIYSHSESDLTCQKKGKCILLLFPAIINCDCICRSSNFRQIETTTNQKAIDCEKEPFLVCDVPLCYSFPSLEPKLLISFIHLTFFMIESQRKSAIIYWRADISYIEDITRWREDMNFMFSWQEQYLTRSLRSLVRYCSCHSNIKFISSSQRVMFFLLYEKTNSTKAKGGNRDVIERCDTHKGDIRKIRHSGPG